MPEIGGGPVGLVVGGRRANTRARAGSPSIAVVATIVDGQVPGILVDRAARAIAGTLGIVKRTRRRRIRVERTVGTGPGCIGYRWVIVGPVELGGTRDRRIGNVGIDRGGLDEILRIVRRSVHVVRAREHVPRVARSRKCQVVRSHFEEHGTRVVEDEHDVRIDAGGQEQRGVGDTGMFVPARWFLALGGGAAGHCCGAIAVA